MSSWRLLGFTGGIFLFEFAWAVLPLLEVPVLLAAAPEPLDLAVVVEVAEILAVVAAVFVAVLEVAVFF